MKANSNPFNMLDHLTTTQALVFVREFVFGSNTTGLVTNTSGTLTVVGGENATLADTVLPGQDEIYVGSGTTQSTFVYPSATIAAWNSFFATARGNATWSAIAIATSVQGSSAGRKMGSMMVGLLPVVVGVVVLLLC